MKTFSTSLAVAVALALGSSTRASAQQPAPSPQPPATVAPQPAPVIGTPYQGAVYGWVDSCGRVIPYQTYSVPYQPVYTVRYYNPCRTVYYSSCCYQPTYYYSSCCTTRRSYRYCGW